MVELRAFKVNKLEVENTVAPGTQLKLQNQVKYNVNYIELIDDILTDIGGIVPILEEIDG